MASAPSILCLHDERAGAAEGIAALVGELSKQGTTAAAKAVVARGRRDPLAIGRTVFQARNERSAVLHAWGAAALAAALIARLRRPLVATLDLRDSLAGWIWPTMRAARSLVARWVAADEATRAWLLQSGVDARRITVIPLPVAPLPPAAMERAALLAQCDWSPETKLIVTCDELKRGACLDETIWCYELVRALHPTARLLIVGAGTDQRRLERYALQVSEPGCVVVANGDWFARIRPANPPFQSPRAHLSPVFRTSEAAFAAALPHAAAYWQLGPAAATPPWLVQAMFAGAPIVASDAPPHAAALDADAGILVPRGARAATARATDEVFTDGARRTTLQSAARDRAQERFAMERVAELHLEVYSRVISGEKK